MFSIINHQCYGVLIYSPLRLYGNVLRGHCRGNCLIPTDEGMAFLGRVCGCGHRRVVVLPYSRNFSAAVRIERYGVLFYVPLRLYGHVLRGHGCGDGLAPANKFIACLGRGCGCGHRRVVFLRYWRDIIAAVRIERYGVPVYSPQRLYGHVLRGHGCGDFLIPPGEGVTCLGRVCGCGYIRVIALRYRRDIIAAVRIERYGILS